MIEEQLSHLTGQMRIETVANYLHPMVENDAERRERWAMRIRDKALFWAAVYLTEDKRREYDTLVASSRPD